MTWLAIGQVLGLIFTIMFQIDTSLLSSLGPDPPFWAGLDVSQLLTNLDLPEVSHTTWTQTLATRFYSFWSSVMSSPLLYPTTLLHSTPEFGYCLVYLCYGVPSIWGFVIVAQMLLDYGNCIRIY